MSRAWAVLVPRHRLSLTKLGPTPILQYRVQGERAISEHRPVIAFGCKVFPAAPSAAASGSSVAPGPSPSIRSPLDCLCQLPQGRLSNGVGTSPGTLLLAGVRTREPGRWVTALVARAAHATFLRCRCLASCRIILEPNQCSTHFPESGCPRRRRLDAGLRSGS